MLKRRATSEPYRRSRKELLAPDGDPRKGHVFEELDMDHAFDCKMLVVSLRHLATRQQSGSGEATGWGDGWNFRGRWRW